MDFPQYLWRIAINDGDIMIRRGHDCNEPIDKFEENDRRYFRDPKILVGVKDTCQITDKRFYSMTHRWDWLNE